MVAFFESFEFWKLLICLFGGVLGAFVLYFRSKEFTNTQKYLLQGLRFMSVFLVLFLLLAPNLRLLQNEYHQPIITLFIDNSELGWFAYFQKVFFKMKTLVSLALHGKREMF